MVYVAHHSFSFAVAVAGTRPEQLDDRPTLKASYALCGSAAPPARPGLTLLARKKIMITISPAKPLRSRKLTGESKQPADVSGYKRLHVCIFQGGGAAGGEMLSWVY